MPATDIELIALSRDGSAAAYGQLVQRHQNLVRAVALSATGELAAAEEVAQEAFITAWKRLPELREPSRFRSWVCGIARNFARYMRRHDQRHAPSGTDRLDRLESLPAQTPSPLDTVIERQHRGVMRDALRRIPDSYREPLVLFYGQDHSIAEVASHLGLSRDTVKQRLSRGRKYLQRGVQELLRSELARPASIGAAVLTAIAALPRASMAATSTGASASASSSLLCSLATSTKLAAGGFVATSLTLVALALPAPSEMTSTPSVEPAAPVIAPTLAAAPIARELPASVQASAQSSVAVPFAPVATVAPVHARSARFRTTRANASRSTLKQPAQEATAQEATAQAATAQATVFEHGPVIVSRPTPGPSVSLAEALAVFEHHTSRPLPAPMLPIAAPDFHNRIVSVDP